MGVGTGVFTTHLAFEGVGLPFNHYLTCNTPRLHYFTSLLSVDIYCLHSAWPAILFRGLVYIIMCEKHSVKGEGDALNLSQHIYSRSLYFSFAVTFFS